MRADRYGSAGNGLTEWYWQRLSAVVLILLMPLPLALVFGIASDAVDQASLLALVDHFFFRLLHTLLVSALLVHAFLGLKVIFEDYVHSTFVRIPLVAAVMALAFTTGIGWLAMIWAW